MARGDKKLSAEERKLWSSVARTTRALPGRMEQLLSSSADAAVPDAVVPVRVKNADAPKGLSAAMKAALAASFAAGNPDAEPRDEGRSAQKTGRRANPIEKPVHRKIAKGRLALEARVDLHGMRQDEAHAVLHDFLARAYDRRLRHVLVITGKGASMGSEGALKRAVPQWLAKPEFAIFVSGHEEAARAHGGAGALYVRLRKRPGEEP